MFQLPTRHPCFGTCPHDGGVWTGRAWKRWCRRVRHPVLYHIFDKTCLQLNWFFLSTVFFFSFFHSGSSDSMCAFLLCYWLCCKESSEQNWFMIHFAAIQTASSEVTKKFCFCTHLINETQRKTRQNRTPTWSSGVPSQAHFAKSREVTCSRFGYLIICLFFLYFQGKNIFFKEQSERRAYL